MTIQEITTTDIKSFNAKAPHPMQSWQWGEARIKTGLIIHRIDTGSDVFTMSIHPIPYTSFNIGYIPRSITPTIEVLEYYKEVAQRHNILFIKFEPYEKKTDSAVSHITNLGLVQSKHPLFPNWTQSIDLTPSLETLSANLKSKTRYNIKLAEKKDVIVKENSTPEGFEIFSKLYFETCKRQHYYGHTKEYHSIIWNTLKDDIAHILIASYENEPLAAYELFYFNNKFYYPYGGSSDKHRNIMPANLLMWEAIKMGKNLGATEFDLWGSLPPTYDPNDSWSGFTRFKEGYGAQFVEYVGSYDLVINMPLYSMYNIAQIIRSLYLNLRM